MPVFLPDRATIPTGYQVSPDSQHSGLLTVYSHPPDTAIPPRVYILIPKADLMRQQQIRGRKKEGKEMKAMSVIHHEATVLLRLKNNFGVPDYVLTEIVQVFGDDLRTSIELGFPAEAIACDLFSRWQESGGDVHETSA